LSPERVTPDGCLKKEAAHKKLRHLVFCTKHL